MDQLKDLAAALSIVKQKGPAFGRHLNHSTYLLNIPPGADFSRSPLPSDIPVTRLECFLLGCALGPLVSFAKNFLGQDYKSRKHLWRPQVKWVMHS